MQYASLAHSRRALPLFHSPFHPHPPRVTVLMSLNRGIEYLLGPPVGDDCLKRCSLKKEMLGKALLDLKAQVTAGSGTVLALGRAPIQQRRGASVENIINTNRPFRHHQHHLPLRLESLPFQGGRGPRPGAIPPS